MKMGCNCKWFEIIVAIVLFIVTLWPALLGAAVSKWIAVIVAIALVLHALMCKNCGSYASEKMPAGKGKAKRR
ncbi:hypothetical protein HY450_04000 [Candidatus Pacearchaeota archaeon]|nr:hypothetical protein [Candidatus Pacearchaeota archaeon]